VQKIAIACATLVLCISILYQTAAQDYNIPSWIKNNAKWWSEGQIGDSDFVKGIQYLIEENIMQIPKTKQTSESDQNIPTWIKTNVKKWYANWIQEIIKFETETIEVEKSLLKVLY